MPKIFKNSNSVGDYYFLCPGCDFLHGISDKSSTSSGHKWEFNGDFDKPTFQPSYLLWEIGPNNERINVCHSYITEGKIQFLSDCFHHLKGQTVDLLQHT